MKLLTKEIERKLRANWDQNHPGGGIDYQIDQKPVLKVFNPCGGATWLFTELDPDGDTLYGLCDLGFGTPELGYCSLEELSTVKGKLGLGMERDRHFTADKLISQYFTEARAKGRIVA